MKPIASIYMIVARLHLTACNNSSSSTTDYRFNCYSTDTTASTGSTDGFKFGVQMWTFRMFPFVDALDKVDSANIKNIEAFWGQKLGGGLPGEFGAGMSADTRTKLKKFCRIKELALWQWV